jgi:hypothetical protein
LARWILISILLLVPLVAMRFTAEVNWSALDFGLAAFLLIGAGAVYDVADRYTHASSTRFSSAPAL